jgi:hypothetical protein
MYVREQCKPVVPLRLAPGTALFLDIYEMVESISVEMDILLQGRAENGLEALIKLLLSLLEGCGHKKVPRGGAVK